LSNAFDTVVRAKLLLKLSWNGICDNLLCFIKFYLTSRFQCSLIEGVRFYYRAVTSGVPQGSVLGHLLFLIFVNDLLLYLQNACHTSNSVKLFADDIKTYRVVNSPLEAIEFQLHINLIEEWFVNWPLTVNIKKCIIVHLGI